ncbi:protein NRT1/ PTR FAMILY 7.3 isoform X4 [Capsicum annuum]|uniref:protein NRT1/ PTR FAMILY 7.3 isoform X4 n=1 Tax=Capsicum annuum TaxID=4072 RepID=UPI001FB139FC|nr:protein NRT1/ PTR FAMILY 7.3 isoform X4 [Capsicum annuum]
MACLNIDKMMKNEKDEYTLDGTVNKHGQPAVRARTGRWFAGVLLLVNQGLATLAFFGVGVNLVLFLTRVMGQDNAEAANNVSKWTGTVYIFSLLGAFLSDSYWGRYKTCAIFQAIFVAGLISLSLTSYIFLVKPNGCGDEETPCGSHSTISVALFYVSIYLIALGNGGYQPTIATFGADQFDEDHPQESHSKVAFFSYFYLALNLGSLFSNTILGYFEDKGMWTLGFWASAGSAILALVLFLIGTPRYRHFKPTGNPLSRFCQVIVAATRKWKIEQPSRGLELYEGDGQDLPDNGSRRILHTQGFKRVLDPLVTRLKKSSPRGLTELQRMGVGLIIAIMTMVAAGIVEHFRLKSADKKCSHCSNSSSLSIFWQVPQYVLIGASEVFMYVGQLEFFNGQAPDGLKSFGSALCMTSISLGNYVSSLLVSVVMKISTTDKMPGWIPGNLNKGHLDRFYFLLAALTSADFLVYLICAKWYKYIKFEERNIEKQYGEKHGDLRV